MTGITVGLAGAKVLAQEQANMLGQPVEVCNLSDKVLATVSPR